MLTPSAKTSWINWLSLRPKNDTEKLIKSLPPKHLLILNNAWQFWARNDQLPPKGDWFTWLILAGRGWGKTRTGAEWVHEVAHMPDARIALIGETMADARMVMVEGESGILETQKPWNPCHYAPSKRQITWHSGAKAFLYSADDPEQLRGPQHSHAWADELAKWHYMAALDNLLFGLRLGASPKLTITTTPRRGKILQQALELPRVKLTSGKTTDNKQNLPAAFLQTLHEKYAGTRLGKQELEAELLTDTEGALWQMALIDQHRVTTTPTFTKTVVAIDPAVSSGKDACETGIVVASLGDDDHAYVRHDGTEKLSADAWAQRALSLYKRFDADVIAAENNNGGDLVGQMIKMYDPAANVRLVRANSSKLARAEPVAALYEQGKVHHTGNLFELEEQMCSFDGSGASPDRLDALVWAIHTLMLSGSDRRPQIRGL